MFSDGEKKRRVEAVRGLMQDEKLDVLLTIGNGCVGTNAYGCFRFLTAANVYYGLQSALFFPCSNPVGIVDSEISCGELKNAGIVTECRISKTPIQAIIDVLKESEITSGRLGTSLDILPQSWRMALEREMPGLVLCDVSEPLFRIRNHHSPEEVALIRQCGKLADAGYAEVLKNVKPGMTEQQVAAELEHATQGMGADYNFTLISTGRFSLEDNQLPCIRAATMFDCVVAHGDCISMEITPRYNGYWTQLVRTISVGEPNEDFIKMHEVSCRIIKGALEELKPGNRIGNIAIKLKQLTEEAGYVFSYPCGHICAIDLNEERITPDNDRPLEEGMAVILHPSIITPKISSGIFWGQTYLITKTGYECLMSCSDDLMSIQA